MSHPKRTNYIADTDVGDDIFDVLNKAALVLLNGTWCPVLGYDESDDVLCAEDFTSDDDWVIMGASQTINWLQVKVAVSVTESRGSL